MTGSSMAPIYRAMSLSSRARRQATPSPTTRSASATCSARPANPSVTLASNLATGYGVLARVSSRQGRTGDCLETRPGSSANSPAGRHEGRLALASHQLSQLHLGALALAVQAREERLHNLAVEL